MFPWSWQDVTMPSSQMTRSEVMAEKCQCQSANHGHKPGACKEKATEKSRMCKSCHEKAAAK
jgi:hypothetical protein